MKIVSEVYGELGKTLLGIGQAMLVAALVAKFFAKGSISWWAIIAGIVSSLVPISVGLSAIQKAHNLKKIEETQS